MRTHSSSCYPDFFRLDKSVKIPMCTSMRLSVLAAMIVPAGVLFAQAEHKLTARELFYTPVSTAPVVKGDAPKPDPTPKVIPKGQKKVVKTQDPSVPDSGERPAVVPAPSFPPLG